MIKHCVFCGNPPIKKNKEHVIPRWLIKLTGDFNREIYIEQNFISQDTKSFSLKEFHFPSCKACNSKYSTLENNINVIVEDMLNSNPIDCDSLNKLLIWFDKVRIGLWLGYRYLNKDYFGISPHFHIDDRIDKADRLLFIYKVDDVKKGLGIIKANTPFFAHYPSCFGLIINNLYFLNASTDYLFSRRLGLPFAAKSRQIDESHMSTDMHSGLNRVLTPLLPISINSKCTKIYQPIIFKEYYDKSKSISSYAKGLLYKNNIGKIFISKSNEKVTIYPTDKSVIWIPKNTSSRDEMLLLFEKDILLIQNYLIKIKPEIDISDEAKGHVNNRSQFGGHRNPLQLAI